MHRMESWLLLSGAPGVKCQLQWIIAGNINVKQRYRCWPEWGSELLAPRSVRYLMACRPRKHNGCMYVNN